MATKKNKNIGYYLNLPWSYTIEQAADENDKKIYIVRVNELSGVVTDAPSIEEAMESIKEALTLAIEMSLEAGEKIQEPKTKSSYKEDIRYKTSAQRRSYIARQARMQKVSLSKIIDALIDAGAERLTNNR